MTTTANVDHLTRSEIWSTQLKDVLEDDLFATQWVNWLSEFPDGTTFTIPSVGQAQHYDYTEDEAIQYTPLDTGEFQLTINKYMYRHLQYLTLITASIYITVRT